MVNPFYFYIGEAFVSKLAISCKRNKDFAFIDSTVGMTSMHNTPVVHKSYISCLPFKKSSEMGGNGYDGIEYIFFNKFAVTKSNRRD